MQGCVCSAAASVSSSSALGRRRARSLEASVASFVTLALPPLSAVHRAASALPQPLPSSSALVGRRRARSTRALPASLHWRFHRCARCRAACALPQPLPSSSALMGRCRARSLDASVASFVTLAFPPLRAVQGCKRLAAAAAFVLGSGSSPCSLEASVASIFSLALPPLCAVQGCMCLAAAAAFVVSALGRRRARSTRASPSSLRWRFPPLCAV